MIERTLIRATMVVAAMVWLARMIFLRSERRKAPAAKLALYEAPAAGASSLPAYPVDAAYFDSLRAFVAATNEVRGKEQIAAPKGKTARQKVRSIRELAGSVKSPISGVSIEGMNPWRQSPSLAWLLRLATQVWGDATDASVWMSTPHFALGGKTPVEAAMTDAGAERVESILWRLIHGFRDE